MANIPRRISFFGRQPKHIQDIVLQTTPYRTAPEVIAYLLPLGIHASADDVYRFRKRYGVSAQGRYTSVHPASSHDLRTRQYIDAVKAFDGTIFRSRTLGLRGSVWAPCAGRLHRAGLIRRVGDTQAVRYCQVATDDEMDAWYEVEVGTALE